MSEVDMIDQYLETCGGTVISKRYYQKNEVFAGGVNFRVGEDLGYQINNAFFFGNVSFNFALSGVVVLTNRNEIIVRLNHKINERVLEPLPVTMQVEQGLVKLGDGLYYGTRRLYGVGLTDLELLGVGVGAATYYCNVSLNGYIWLLK